LIPISFGGFNGSATARCAADIVKPSLAAALADTTGSGAAVVATLEVSGDDRLVWVRVR